MNEDYLLKKWLNDDLNNEERQMFFELEDSNFNERLIEDAKAFKASQFASVADFATFKERVYPNNGYSVRMMGWVNSLLRVAAVVVVTLGLYFVLFSNGFTEVNTLAGEKMTIDLPDLSKVELNALSGIEYNEKGWKDERSLRLDGEAYFKVAKGQTFLVETETGTITVVGTQFNVKQRQDYFEVKCFEGIVEVQSDTIVRRLVAGNSYSIIDGEFTLGTINYAEPRWINNISRFEAIPYREVVNEFERQYDVKISYEEVDLNRIFTGGFTHDHLESALISITEPMNLTYEISSSNDVLIHGEKN